MNALMKGLSTAMAFGVLLVSTSESGAAELGDLLRATLEHPAVQARSLETQAARDDL